MAQLDHQVQPLVSTKIQAEASLTDGYCSPMNYSKIGNPRSLGVTGSTVALIVTKFFP